MHGAWLEDLTRPEAERRFKAGAVVVVPIGAIAKEHGHHLPLKTDWLVAREFGRRIAAALPVVVAPVVCFGYSPAFVRYPGSQHLSAETFIAVLKEVIGNLIDHGVTRIAVANTGVSTEAPLRIALRDIYQARQVRVVSTDIRSLAAATRKLAQPKLGGHGDKCETSMILAIDRAAARMDRARADYGHDLGLPKTVFYQPVVFDGDPSTGPDYSATGVKGDPSLATAEKGEAILAEMARELIEGLRLLYPDAPGMRD